MKFDVTQQIVVQLYELLDLKLVSEAIPAPMPAYSPESNILKMAPIYGALRCVVVQFEVLPSEISGI